VLVHLPSGAAAREHSPHHPLAEQRRIRPRDVSAVRNESAVRT
jgi:hypothetical protein